MKQNKNSPATKQHYLFALFLEITYKSIGKQRNKQM